MSIFGKKKRYLGVDIGTANLKVVELEDVGNQAKLITYGLVKIPNNIIRSESEEMINEVSGALKLIVEKAGVTSKSAVSALPGFAIFSSMTELAKAKDEVLNQAIKQEAEKMVPVGLEEMNIDWEKISEHDNQLKILITAAPKKLVDRYKRIFNQAGLILESLEIEAIALIRSIVGADLSPILLVDIGSAASDIHIVDQGSLVFTRTVDIGGQAITSAIALALNINQEKAEQFKRDIGLLAPEGQEVPHLVKNALEAIIDEVRRSSNIFHNKEGKQIQKIILCGGSAKLPGLAEYFSQEIGIEVALGDVWKRVIYPPQIEETVKSVGLDYAVAIGLAMREIY